MRLSPALRETLARVAAVTKESRERWWIIAGAAAALHGEVGTVADVDLLMHPGDARDLLRRLRLRRAPHDAHRRFRSELFARWLAPPLAVEIMAGFQVAGPRGWSAVWPDTRVPIAIDGHPLFVPDREELAALFRRFRRSKDLSRARRLERPWRVSAC